MESTAQKTPDTAQRRPAATAEVAKPNGFATSRPTAPIDSGVERAYMMRTILGESR